MPPLLWWFKMLRLTLIFLCSQVHFWTKPVFASSMLTILLRFVCTFVCRLEPNAQKNNSVIKFDLPFITGFVIKHVVHGGFSPWGEWMQCPVTCSGAVVNRTRSCNNPSPRNDGQPCEGPTRSSTLCADIACPGMLKPLVISYPNTERIQILPGATFKELLSREMC